ncbi:MAG: helicase-related protein [Spirochaetaceae bacterium]
MRLEDLTPGTRVEGIVSNGSVSVVSVRWFGNNSLQLYYEDHAGRPGQTLLYRDSEASLRLAERGVAWAFDADGNNFKLASEAMRIRLAHLFDPYVAVNSSDVEPLPHQITAVYEKMLQRQPLRYLIADDPGAGKTIMAGLLIKELSLRGALERCLVVCPGNLAEQWQDELSEKFDLPFEILTNDKLEASRTGNWFNENNLVIGRLDKLSRDEDLHPKLEQTEWDLIVVDEAHKMSATYFGAEAKYTKRYHLGQLLSTLCRHFLLLTATPHNGKEEDFQLFLSLLDGDRFEGRFRDGVHTADTRDLMRRLVKEQLVRFDGSMLFPERRAYTVNYELSDLEAHLYEQVTNYVREGFNRAERLENERKGNVGFALTILQRRLASSPAAIYESLRRRRERLEARLEEEKLIRRGKQARQAAQDDFWLSVEELEDIDDAPDTEAEDLEEELLDRATTAQTIEELETEIEELKALESLAHKVVRQGTDRKWEELSKLLQTQDEMFDSSGSRRKLVIFTEHKDTLRYLAGKTRTLLGRDEAVVTISGGMAREDRKRAEQQFKQDKNVEILVATDAAGEGINLQRAHLMVNYDLPWNPNRLEQRFGRIHRIGQTEVCHLWNLVAGETREGQVFGRLLGKLEAEREALHGRVFDVLGQIFEGTELRDLLIRAVRSAAEGDGGAEQVFERIGELMDHERLQEILRRNALSEDTLDATDVQHIRDMMDRAQARKLQPHFIRQFFFEAFAQLGGKHYERESGRYELTHVPAVIRNRDRQIGVRNVVLRRYERVTFDREKVRVSGKPQAELISPGHPLLGAVIDLILERHKSLFKQGAVLVDENPERSREEVTVFLHHRIIDGSSTSGGREHSVSEQLHFVSIDGEGSVADAGYAPFLNYRPAKPEEIAALNQLRSRDWVSRGMEEVALGHAIQHIVPRHIDEVRGRRLAIIDKTRREVQRRLTQEITYWDHRAASLRAEERAGKRNARINSQRAEQRVEELQGRLDRRLGELDAQRQLSPQPPVVLGAALVVPAYMVQPADEPPQESEGDTASRKEVERLAMEAVMSAERALGNDPRDVSAENHGWDIESRDQESERLRLIEVKGRGEGETTLTISKNEIIQGLNKEEFILAIVLVRDGEAGTPHYVRRPFEREPAWNETSVNYNLQKLLSVADEPG